MDKDMARRNAGPLLVMGVLFYRIRCLAPVPGTDMTAPCANPERTRCVFIAYAMNARTAFTYWASARSHKGRAW